MRVKVARRESRQREAKGEEEIGCTLQINGITHGGAEIWTRTEYFEKKHIALLRTGLDFGLQ